LVDKCVVFAYKCVREVAPIEHFLIFIQQYCLAHFVVGDGQLNVIIR